jgi:uncharacterized Zn-binding protein involved in type VI secretion
MGVSANGVGAVPAAIAAFAGGKKNTIYARETGYGNRRRTVIVFNDHIIAGADEAGVVGKFIEKVYSFPQGRIMFEGASADLQLDRAPGTVAAGLADAWDGDFALGTAVGAGASMTTTEQDLIPTGSTAQAVAGVTVAQAGSTATEAPKLFDGSVTVKDVYFNQLVDDADHDIAGNAGTSLRVNGEIVINWAFVGQK